MTPAGLVLQGGGALGAYEWGAVHRLIEAGYIPTVLTGVSIGAINAAAIAGAKGGDALASLDRLWHAIALPEVPFLPRGGQSWLSLFGNPAFYRLRADYLTWPNWTSWCDVSPMRRTLTDLLDLDALNDTARHRAGFTATNIATGQSERFNNLTTRLGVDHVLASGSLPPGFPATKIGDGYYWDGGLFDNTPLRPLIEMLTPEESESLPIFVVDLFPTADAVPSDMAEVRARMTEIAYENRSWDDFGGPQGMRDHAAMLREIDAALPADSPLKATYEYQRMMEYRALANLHAIEAPHMPMTGGTDFSEYGVKRRRDAGYEATRTYLEKNNLIPIQRAAA